MLIVAQGLVLLIALLHIYILVLEMFLWDTPKGRKAFGMTAEQASITKVMAQNQGLYNGFLAAGLMWALWTSLSNPQDFIQLANFFLSCVLVAGLYGGVTAHKKILFIQAVPALLGLLAVNLA